MLSWFETYLSITLISHSFNVSWQGHTFLCHPLPTRLGSWAPSLCNIHHFTGSIYMLTWPLISLLHRVHPAILVIPTRQHSILCADQCFSLRHTLMDDRIQLNLSKTELLVTLANQSLHYNITTSKSPLHLSP